MSDLPNFREAQAHEDRIDDPDLLTYLSQTIRRAATKAASVGNVYLAVHAATELAQTNEIILIGPPRVGKSQLVSVLSGQNVTIAPTLDSVTRIAEAYRTNLATFWDTPGVENWTRADVEAFKYNLVHVRKVRPISMLVMVSPGCFMDTSALNIFLEFAAQYEIQVVFVVTKCYALDAATRRTYASTFKELVKSDRDQPVGYVSFQVAANAYICFVNSVPFISEFSAPVPSFGISELKRVIYCRQSPEVKKNLIKLSMAEANWTERFEAFGIEVLYHMGFDSGILDEEEQAHFEAASGKPLVQVIDTFLQGRGKEILTAATDLAVSGMDPAVAQVVSAAVKALIK